MHETLRVGGSDPGPRSTLRRACLSPLDEGGRQVRDSRNPSVSDSAPHAGRASAAYPAVSAKCYLVLAADKVYRKLG